MKVIKISHCEECTYSMYGKADECEHNDLVGERNILDYSKILDNCPLEDEPMQNFMNQIITI